MKNRNLETGISIIELLIAIVFTSIVAMAVTKSVIVAQRVFHKTEHHSAAMQLMIETIEQYASVNPETFSSTMNVTNKTVEKNGITFLQSLVFGNNPDRSRFVTVSIRDPKPLTGFTISQTATFTLWGAR